MIMEKSDVDLNLTMHKILVKTAGIGDISLSKFGQQKMNELSTTRYCFMAGPLSGSDINPFNRKGKGVCIVYFPVSTSVFIKYFASAGIALEDYWGLYHNNLRLHETVKWLQERKYLSFQCNLVEEVLG